MNEFSAENMRKIAKRTMPLFSKESMESDIRDYADRRDLKTRFSIDDVETGNAISEWLNPLGFKTLIEPQGNNSNLIISISWEE